WSLAACAESPRGGSRQRRLGRSARRRGAQRRGVREIGAGPPSQPCTVYVTGRLFASYSADALIVASSTGSTAYSFAAGGPIVSPQLDALIFTPVAPHMAFDRSLV